jgi:hypothetical protein
MILSTECAFLNLDFGSLQPSTPPPLPSLLECTPRENRVHRPAKPFYLKQKPAISSVKVALFCTHSHKKKSGNYRTMQAFTETQTRELSCDNLFHTLDY